MFGGNIVETQDAEIDSIPVKVVIELGQVEVRLVELHHIAPGTVLPINRSPELPVDISVNGKQIGVGALVRIGDTLGVRIIRLIYLD